MKKSLFILTAILTVISCRPSRNPMPVTGKPGLSVGKAYRLAARHPTNRKSHRYYTGSNI